MKNKKINMPQSKGPHLLINMIKCPNCGRWWHLSLGPNCPHCSASEDDEVSECKFAEGWKNQEGWLVMSNGKLVCLDWDEYCTECRVDNSKDYVFEVSTKPRTEVKK